MAGRTRIFRSAKELTGSRTLPMPPDVIRGVMAEREVSVLYGQPGSGKSWLALEMAYAVATGSPWLGMETSQHPVVYVDLEITLEAFSNRMERVRERLGAPEDADIRVVSPEVAGGWNAGDLVSAIDGAGVRGALVIVDCLYMLERDDENSNSAMAQLLQTLKRMCIEGGNTLFVVHHTAKGQAGSRSVVDRGAGAGAIGRFCNNRISLLRLDMPDSHGAAEGFRMEMVLRDHAGKGPVDLWFDGTGFGVDSEGELSGLCVEGSPRAKAAKGAEASVQRNREARERKAALVAGAIADLEESGIQPTWRNVLGCYNERAEEEGLPEVKEATFRDWLKPGRPFPYGIENGLVAAK